MTRRDTRFDNEPPVLRDGHLETTTLLAHAAGSSNPAQAGPVAGGAGVAAGDGRRATAA